MAGTGEPVAGWLRRVILLHDHIIRTYGGSPGILDASLLQAAIERPWTGLADGTSFYPDVLDKAAVLLERINTYHAFVDGNKRTGTMLALEFLRREGYIADVENAEIVDVAVRVAQKQMKHSEVVQWLDRITSRAMADTSTKDPGPLTFRPATAADREFAFRLKKATLGEQIRQVWGWDEEEQRRLHEGRFAAQDFQVIRASGAEVGLLALDRRPDSVNVNQLLVCPEYQGRGIGTACMMQVIKCAADLPVRLRVLKVNRRAAGFYRRLGFSVSGETETHLLMERRPGAGAD